MSVVLTACRHSKQRAIERALKKRAEKQKQKRLAEQQFLSEYEPVELTDLALTRMWCFQMLGNVYTVVLLLESGKEFVEIFCNDEGIPYSTDIENGTIRFDFLIDGSHHAQISCRQHSEGMQHSLTIHGHTVPEVE